MEATQSVPDPSYHSSLEQYRVKFEVLIKAPEIAEPSRKSVLCCPQKQCSAKQHGWRVVTCNRGNQDPRKKKNKLAWHTWGARLPLHALCSFACRSHVETIYRVPFLALSFSSLGETSATELLFSFGTWCFPRLFLMTRATAGFEAKFTAITFTKQPPGSTHIQLLGPHPRATM